MKRKKKKGRPSLTDLQKRQRLLQQQQQQQKHNQNFQNKKILIHNHTNHTNNINNTNTNNNTNNSLITTSSSSPSSPANYDSTPAAASRRSTRRNPNLSPNSTPTFEEDDDDDERKEKKVKLVVRLPQSNNLGSRYSQPSDSGSGSGSEESDGELDLGGDEQRMASPKKRKINAVDRRSDDAVSLQEEKVAKATENRYGSQLESGPTSTLPDKKLLLFILDRLQKKDTYGVFSEPVDRNELPDYHEIIEHPMDFGTVRRKLGGGIYSNLDELEADVLLICSNAMQYNAADTVYFRQARAIQELAKRDFANLRHEGDDGEPQPKIVRRGRPPSKNLKKPVESSTVDRIGLEVSSGATLASGEDKAVGSNSYSVRKAPAPYRFRSSDPYVTPHRTRNGESDWSVDWNSEFPGHILRADMKYGKKNFIVDENKRDSYRDYHPPAFDNDLSMLSNNDGDVKRLMPVGLHFDRHVYARSLAKFTADLGPVAWKIASRKIETVLPAGVKFGRGWVGENDAPSEPSSSSAEKLKSPTNASEPPPMLTENLKSPSNVASDCHSSRPATASPPGHFRPSEEMVEAVRRLNSQSELAVQGSASPWGMQGSVFQAQLKSSVPVNRNGFNSMVGYNLSQLGGMGRPAMPSRQPGAPQGPIPPPQTLGVDLEEPKPLQGWGAPHPANRSARGRVSEPSADKSSDRELAAQQQRQPPPIPPDLNVRVQAPGSPSSGLRIGSPQQPDLALQL